MRKIKQIVVHCTDSQDSLDIGVKDVNSWHLERGFDMIGYHYLIKRSGEVQRGRPDSRVGAHVKGHNKRSIGISWVGRNVITPNQYNALLNLVRSKMDEYKIEIEGVVGHSELDAHKTCPNLDMNLFRANVLFKDKAEAKKGVENVPERSPIWEKVSKSYSDDG